MCWSVLMRIHQNARARAINARHNLNTTRTPTQTTQTTQTTTQQQQQTATTATNSNNTNEANRPTNLVAVRRHRLVVLVAVRLGVRAPRAREPPQPRAVLLLRARVALARPRRAARGHAPAHAARLVEHLHLAARIGERPCARRAGQARAHDPDARRRQAARRAHARRQARRIFRKAP